MFADVGSVRIAYERAGSGACVLLLHGYVGDADSTWRHQIDSLSNEFMVVAPDLPGSGRSTDPPESFSLADFADTIAGFASSVGVDRFHVVGLSYGGGLAIELYRRHPSRVRSLVLAGAYAGWSGSLPPDEVDRRLNQVLRLADRPPDEFAALVAPTMFSQDVDASVLRRFADGISTFHPAGLRVMARSFAEADLRAVIGSIDVPTLLVYGDKDVRAPLAIAHEMHAAIPGARLVILEGIGHVSSVEASERFTDEVRAFLHLVGE